MIVSSSRFICARSEARGLWRKPLEIFFRVSKELFDYHKSIVEFLTVVFCVSYNFLKGALTLKVNLLGARIHPSSIVQNVENSQITLVLGLVQDRRGRGGGSGYYCIWIIHNT